MQSNDPLPGRGGHLHVCLWLDRINAVHEEIGQHRLRRHGRESAGELDLPPRRALALKAEAQPSHPEKTLPFC